MRGKNRSAFTIFELLLLLAILGFLLGLLLPLLARMREAASRMSSSNNLKQIGLACHNYYSVHNQFPSGRDANGFSVHSHLLPYIEQDNLWKNIDFKKAPDAGQNAVIANTAIKVFLSPIDPATPTAKAPGTNYFFNAGSDYSLNNNNGVFYDNSKTRFVGITDGTSNTLMTIESLRGMPIDGKATVQRQYVQLPEKALNNLNKQSGVAEFKAGKGLASDRGAQWIEGKFLQTLFAVTREFNDDRPDVNCAGKGGMSAMRGLKGGTHVGLCDGSVRFIAAGISIRTLQNAATRNGGEVLGNDW